MRIISPDFENDAPMPLRCGCEGENINPELVIENIPRGTASLVLIMENIDSRGGIFDHWVCYDIPPVSRIGAGQSPGLQGINSFDNGGYEGPCPSSSQPHTYRFSLFALDRRSGLAFGASREEVDQAMRGHVIEQCQLTGRYIRHNAGASA